MPIIKIKKRKLLNQILIFRDQLKSRIKKDEVEMKDHGREDLLSEDGISRQIAIFRDQHRLNDQIIENLTTIELNLKTVEYYFGAALETEDIVGSLRRFGYKIISEKNKRLILQIPFFRKDIATENDVLEDIMLFNLNKFKAAKGFIIKVNYQNKEDIFDRNIARKLIGFGFKELNLPLLEGIIENQVNQKQSLRATLLPSLLQYEKSRQHLKYPHKLFEIGLVVNKSQQNKKISLIISDAKADFNELYSIINILYDKRELNLIIRKSKCYAKNASFDIILDKKKIGMIGILSEEYKNKFRIKRMCICAEIKID